MGQTYFSNRWCSAIGIADIMMRLSPETPTARAEELPEHGTEQAPLAGHSHRVPTAQDGEELPSATPNLHSS
jgi:hypothetical protein